jgi:hypothetical protein
MQIEKLNRMTTKQKQVFAAQCFSKFCAEKGIIHDSINELIEHLMSIEKTESVINWEQKGTLLEFTSRGDLIPEKINMLISPREIEYHSMNS